MSVFDRLKERLSGEQDGKVKVRKKRLTRADIQTNLIQIDELMKKAQNDIMQLTDQMASLDLNKESEKQRYEKLRTEMNDKNEIYRILQEQQKRNLEHLETLNKTGRSDKVWKGVTVVGTIFLSVVGLGLNRESPGMLKVVDFITKPFRAPLKF